MTRFLLSLLLALTLAPSGQATPLPEPTRIGIPYPAPTPTRIGVPFPSYTVYLPAVRR